MKCNTTREIDMSLGQHASSDDPLGTYQAMRSLITEKPVIQKILCLIYKQDFLAFGYTFPPVCDSVFNRYDVS